MTMKCIAGKQKVYLFTFLYVSTYIINLELGQIKNVRELNYKDTIFFITTFQHFWFEFSRISKGDKIVVLKMKNVLKLVYTKRFQMFGRKRCKCIDSH